MSRSNWVVINVVNSVEKRKNEVRLLHYYGVRYAKFGCDNWIKIILDSDCYVVVLGWQRDRNHQKKNCKLELNE